MPRGRPRVRIATIPDDTLVQMKTMFGKPWTAYLQLQLVNEVSFPEFTEIWKGNLMSVKVAEAVLTAWTQWTKPE